VDIEFESQPEDGSDEEKHPLVLHLLMDYIYIYILAIQDMLLLVFVCARINQPFITPPKLLQYYCATFVRDFCAIYDLPPTLPVDAIHHTILIMTISCKG